MLFSLAELTAQLRDRLSAERAGARAALPYCIMKTAPAIGARVELDVDCAFDASRAHGGIRAHYAFATVSGPRPAWFYPIRRDTAARGEGVPFGGGGGADGPRLALAAAWDGLVGEREPSERRTLPSR